MSQKLEVYGLDQKTMTAVVNKLENKGGKKIGLQYLPFFDTPTEETMWDVVKAVSPLADFRAVDGEAKLVGRQAFDRMYADVVSLAQKERFNASDLRKIREAGMLPVVDGNASLVSQMGAAAKKKVRDALQRCKDAIDNRLEWMQVNALLGKIDSPSTSPIKFAVDYGIAPGQSGVVPSILWSTVATSTPLADLQDWQQTVLENTGVLLDTVIMSRKSLSYILKSTLMKAEMAYTGPMLSLVKAQQVIEANTGLKIELYDSTYTSEDGLTVTRFLAENKIIMLPSSIDGGLGDTARVMHPLANYNPGYYSWTTEKNDPYGIEAGVGLDAFPRIKHPEALFNATVF
jgi:hypothetical protein